MRHKAPLLPLLAAAVAWWAAAVDPRSAQAAVTLEHRDDVPACVQFGLRELGQALSAPRPDGGVGRVIVESLEQPAREPRRASFESAVPAAPESFAIRRNGDGIYVLGRDAVGAMYGALAVAETIRAGGSLAAVTDVAEKPFLAFRAANQFLHEEALQDPNSWFFDAEFWEGYFALLARTRHNVLDLHGGYGVVATNFPNIFPYFVHLADFPGQSVGRAATERNLAMLNRIIAAGKRHGVNVAFMNYTVQGRPSEEKSELFVGFDSARLARYTYQASRAFLEGCPDLWMYGFRIGESGQPEDFFQKTYLAALADSGFRGKLFTRSWLATRENIETIKRGFSGELLIEVKYNGEQLCLPYQAMTSPTQFDASYSYQTYANEPRGFKLVYQVRANGTNRVFHWGEPEFVARVVRSCRLGDAAGYSVEPMSAYYPMEDRSHPAAGHRYFKWGWQRDWFWYELWGRLAYDPATPRSVFQARFAQRFGVGAGAALYELETVASEVVPLIGSTLTLGPDHRQWAPELETGNPDFTDLSGRRSFGTIEDALNVSSLDPTVMSSVADAAAAEIADRFDGRVDPRTSAERLFRIAERITDGLARAPKASANVEEAECIRLDAAALASLARAASERYLAAVELAKYRLTSFPRCLAGAKHHLTWAREHWRRLAEIADHHYAPLLDTLRMRTQAYRWESQLAVFDADLAHLAALERAWDPEAPGKAPASLAHRPGRQPNFDPAVATAELALPIQWRASSFERTVTGGQPALRSTTGQIAFDVNDGMLCDADADLTLELAYWNPPAASGQRITVQFDRVGAPASAFAEALTITRSAQPGWQIATINLNHVRFANAGPTNYDLLVRSADGGELVMQDPRWRVRRAPKPRLELHVAEAMKRTPAKPLLHWRTASGAWQTTTLIQGTGAADLETLPRAREFFHCDLPDADAPSGIEYYFTVDLSTGQRRLPEGNDVFRWRRRAETVPPVIAVEPPRQSSQRVGPVEVRTRISDASGVARVVLHHKPIPSQKEWQSTEMKAAADGSWVANVPLTVEGLLYRCTAWDTLGNAAHFPDFRSETPYRVIPSWDPAANSNTPLK